MQRFVLTHEEKQVIVFVVIAFFLGLITKHYRDAHPQPVHHIERKHSHAHLLSPSPSASAKVARKK